MIAVYRPLEKGDGWAGAAGDGRADQDELPLPHETDSSACGVAPV